MLNDKTFVFIWVCAKVALLTQKR